MHIIEPIYTSSLIIREFTKRDVPKVYVMSVESGIRNWIPDQVYRNEEHTSEVLGHLIDQYNDLRTPAEAPCVLGVCLRHSGKLIGHVGLSPMRGHAEIGYAIEDKEQGRGYATQAVSAMARWGHEKFSLPKILGIVASGNVGSCSVLEKSGFVLVHEETGSLNGWHGVIRTYESAEKRRE
ncbi:MAG: GNAT family N-acetyltransferase [Deltaproteobacteria bacterium]|nr:GNAT family N-acetyltransferase [Deltaproteobacteria bacterium]